MEYKEKAPHGKKIHYYPGGVRDADTVPLIGFIGMGWPCGVSDLAILPPYDGAVIYKDHVPHISDSRLKNHAGQPSPLAAERGAWDFAGDEGPGECAECEDLKKELMILKGRVTKLENKNSK